MAKAVLVLSGEFKSRARVQLTFEYTLEECVAVAAEIEALAENEQVQPLSYELRSLGLALRDLKTQAEDSIKGLRFEADPAPEG